MQFLPTNNLIMPQAVSILDTTNNISTNMLDVIKEKQLEVEKYANDNKEDFEEATYLKLLGIKKCSNVQCFDFYKYDIMMNFLKIFRRKKASVLEQYPFMDHSILKDYCKDNDLIFKNRNNYYDEISKSNVEKLRKNIEILEKGLPTEEFFNILYGDWSNDVKWTCDEKRIKSVLGKINKKKESFKLNPEQIGEDYFYQLAYKPTYIIENEEKTVGFFTMELYDNVHIILFDWDISKENALKFKDYVEKNKIDVEEVISGTYDPGPG